MTFSNILQNLVIFTLSLVLPLCAGIYVAARYAIRHEWARIHRPRRVPRYEEDEEDYRPKRPASELRDLAR